jgi:hypothetical protein
VVAIHVREKLHARALQSVGADAAQDAFALCGQIGVEECIGECAPRQAREGGVLPAQVSSGAADHRRRKFMRPVA